MLKKRLIPILLLKDDRFWKSIQFDSLKDVGYPKTAVKVYESQEADELVILNIDKNLSSFSSLIKWVNILSQECCMPLAVGGGIRTFDQVQELFDTGADKVILNTINYQNLKILEKTAAVYGVQSVTVSIDTKYDFQTNNYKVYSNGGKSIKSRSLIEHINLCGKSGAGEFFIQSIDRDGVMRGLDIELGKQATQFTKRPVVLAGGVGTYADLEGAFKSTTISGIGCASIFHFTDSNPLRANAYLANADILIKRV